MHMGVDEAGRHQHARVMVDRRAGGQARQHLLGGAEADDAPVVDQRDRILQMAHTAVGRRQEGVGMEVERRGA